jgi:hypothetical protein
MSLSVKEKMIVICSNICELKKYPAVPVERSCSAIKTAFAEITAGFAVVRGLY